jgi:hypothetical protein
MTKTILAMLTLAGVVPAALGADNPPVTITLGGRQAHVTPLSEGFTHTGGGNIDVAQPSPDTVVITMTGVAVAGAHPFKGSVASLNFELEQCVEIVFDKPETKQAKLSVEGRVIGLLRSHNGGGSATQCPGSVAISNSAGQVLALTVQPHDVAGGQNLSVNCKEDPAAALVSAGRYTVSGKWSVSANHPKSIKPCKAASAEFAPDPALDPLWISYWEPFHGAAKKDFGFQIAIKVTADSGAGK